MSFANIAGIEVEFVRFRERPRTFRGEVVDAFDNTLLDGTDSQKRSWEGETIEMLAEDADALRAAIDAGAVVCTGPAFRNANLSCKVTLEGASFGPDVSGGYQDWTGFNESLSLVIREA
jgi:hypothetical protein